MSMLDKILGMSPGVLNHLGYWVILFFAIIEATPIFGLVVPGQVIVGIGGFFAKLGILNFWYVLMFSALGAVIGDLIGFLLGRKYGYSFVSRFGRYVFFRKRHYEATKKMMNSHAGKALVIGRFNSLTRAFAPFVAGATRVKFSRFLPFAVIGGISWAFVFTLLGYLFGRGYEIAAKYVGQFILIAIVAIVLIVYAFRYVNKRKHIFARHDLYILLLNIFSVYVFAKMVQDVVGKDLITKFDVLLNQKMPLLWTPLLTKIMIFITSIANTYVMLALSIILLCLLVYKKKKHYYVLFVSTIMAGLVSELLVKLLLHRARPENALFYVSSGSFPSGHATTALIFFSMLLYSFKNDIREGIKRNAFIAANIVLFLLIGFSRLYLNVHWLSDVIAGFALGTFWITFLLLAVKVIESVKKKPTSSS